MYATMFDVQLDMLEKLQAVMEELERVAYQMQKSGFPLEQSNAIWAVSAQLETAIGDMDN